MKNYHGLTRRYAPTIRSQRLGHCNNVMDDLDRRKREKEKALRKKEPGPRAEFLKKYKVEGYDEAKKAINFRFGKEVYNDSILKQWIEEDEAQK